MGIITNYLSMARGKLRLPLSIHTGAIGILVILHDFGFDPVGPFISQYVVIWAGLNLIAIALERRFITPEVINPKCPVCGNFMTTAGLKCDQCGGIFK